MKALRLVNNNTVNDALTWWCDYIQTHELSVGNPRANGAIYLTALRASAVKHEDVLEGIVAEYLNRVGDGTLREPIWPGIDHKVVRGDSPKHG